MGGKGEPNEGREWPGQHNGGGVAQMRLHCRHIKQLQNLSVPSVPDVPRVFSLRADTSVGARIPDIIENHEIYEIQ